VDKAQYENEVETRMGAKADAALAIYADAAKISPGLALGSLDAELKYICPTSIATETLSKWTTCLRL
jgi:para-nitrobenzyl esterase